MDLPTTITEVAEKKKNTAVGVHSDLEVIRRRIEHNLQSDDTLKVSGIYLWCYSQEEFLGAMKLFSKENAKTYFRGTQVCIEERLPGGLMIQATTDYKTIGTFVDKTVNIVPDPIKFKGEFDKTVAQLFEDRLGVEVPDLSK